MEAGVEPRSLYLDSGTGGMGTHARTQGHGDRDLQTHTHGRHVDTGPNQSHTDIGTDEGFETQTHRDMDTDVAKTDSPGKLHKPDGEGTHLCAYFKDSPPQFYLEMLFVAVS